MVDVRRVLGNWAVCSVKTDVEAVANVDGELGGREEVVRVVSYSSPILTVNDRSRSKEVGLAMTSMLLPSNSNVFRVSSPNRRFDNWALPHTPPPSWWGLKMYTAAWARTSRGINSGLNSSSWWICKSALFLLPLARPCPPSHLVTVSDTRAGR